MRYLTGLFVTLWVLALAGCGAGTGPVSPAVSDMRLEAVEIGFGPDISRTATGEEFASNFLWAGSGEGNRKRQVIGLFREAAEIVAREAFTGSRPVALEVEVTYFHGIPEWARYVCCGYHNIRANLTLIDPATGTVLARGEDVSLGRVGLGGVPKAVAELAGRSERDLVRDGIVDGIRGWLGTI